MSGLHVNVRIELDDYIFLQAFFESFCQQPLAFKKGSRADLCCWIERAGRNCCQGTKTECTLSVRGLFRRAQDFLWGIDLLARLANQCAQPPIALIVMVLPMPEPFDGDAAGSNVGGATISAPTRSSTARADMTRFPRAASAACG